MPPGSRTSDSPSTSLRREIDKLDRDKANKEATRTKFGELEKDLDETKRIALSARKKAGTHECHQEERMKSVEGKSAGWNKFFRGLVIALIVGGFGAGGYFVKIELTKADKTEVQAVKKDVTTMKSDVSEMKRSQEKIEDYLEPDAQLELEKKKMKLLKEAMKEAVHEARADIQPNRNRRRTN